MIQQAVLQRPDAYLEQSMLLWERLAVQLISVIGEGGFNSLYARALHLSKKTFPWLADCALPAPDADASQFDALKTCLGEREFAEASQASIRVLITFIDILTVLIGEHLTTSILRSAWGDDALEPAVKEINHE